MVQNSPDAVRNTHVWFDKNSGWAPPDPDTLAEWLADGVCRCPDECLVEPAEWCAHGLASWWLILMALDQPTRSDPLDADRLLPHPHRLDPQRPDYVAVVSAHHRAIVAGEATYSDPATGFMVMTARTLSDQGRCCEQGCRHCPFLPR